MAAKKRTTMVGLDAIFSQVNQYGHQESLASLIPLDAIRPDPDQPRRLLPPDLYGRLFAGEAPGDILADWMALAAEATGQSPFNPLSEKIESLRQLAATIEQHGLINAITVQENDSIPGADYLIITGERRWWAHVLLSEEGRLIKGQPADLIEAKIAPAEAIRALQLIENMARDDLSAWERATGIQALREELGGKAVTWTEVEKIIGISRQHRTRIMRVLRLGQEARTLVRDYGLAEKTIRPVAEKLLDRPDLQVVALRQLIAWQQASEESGHDRLSDYVDRLLAKRIGETVRVPAFDSARWTSSFSRRVKSALALVSKLDDEQAAATADVLAQDKKTRQALVALREQLDRLLSASEV
jgi:ParB/RepB/Spo0J family partition protein